MERPRLKEAAAGVLATTMTVGVAGGAAAQEQSPTPDQVATNPNPLAEFCDPETLMPRSEQTLPTGDTVIFESPAPSESPVTTGLSEEVSTENTSGATIESNESETKTAYEKFEEILNQETFPDCDFKKVLKSTKEYLDTKVDEGVIDNSTNKNNRLSLEFVEAEMKKKPNKRYADTAAQGLTAYYDTYLKTRDDEAITLAEAYVNATAPEVPTEDFIRLAKQFLEGYQDDFTEITIEESDNANKPENTSLDEDVQVVEEETPELKNITKLIKEKHEKRSINTVAKEVLKAFKDDEKAINAFASARGWTPEEVINRCTKTKNEAKQGSCSDVAMSLIHTYATLRDEKYWELTDKWLDAILTDKSTASKSYQKLILVGFKQFEDFYPQIYK